jgi:hypothetical protein
MSKANEYRRQAQEAAARADWCEKKLAFERKRQKAFEDLAVDEDWLEGKINPTPGGQDVRTMRVDLAPSGEPRIVSCL